MDRNNDWLDELLYKELSEGTPPSPELDYKLKRKMRTCRNRGEDKKLGILFIIASFLFSVAVILGLILFQPSLKVVLFILSEELFTGLGVMMIYYYTEGGRIREC